MRFPRITAGNSLKHLTTTTGAERCARAPQGLLEVGGAEGVAQRLVQTQTDAGLGQKVGRVRELDGRTGDERRRGSGAQRQGAVDG